MKLSKSKLALAKVINENGGWHDNDTWLFSTQSGDGVLKFWESKPKALKGCVCTEWSGGCRLNFALSGVIKNWHQTILSREEYYQAYPKADADGWIEWSGAAKSPVSKGVAVDVKMKNGTQHFGQLIDDECWGDHWGDASIIAYRQHKQDVKPEFCESVMRSIPDPATKPTIEQLAQDYRNKLDSANRKQQEADDAKADADAALVELERAGEALGLLIGIVKPEPELAITDWRDLRVGDEIECVGYGHPHTIGVVEMFDEISVDQNISVRHQNGDASWPRLWKFIRRP